MYGLPYYERGNQAMHGEVAPYNDDVQGAEGEKESEDEEYFDTSDVLSPEDRERSLIRKKHTD